jgi:hypothetical protein
MRFFSILILFFLQIPAFSQVELKEKVILTSSDSSHRAVTGISYPQEQSNAINAGALVSGQLIYSEATGINVLTVTLYPEPVQYVQGMIVNFKATVNNTGPVQLQINNLSVAPLKKNGYLDLDSLDLVAGQPVTAIYDGANFQVLSRLNKKCPNGFVDVNADYCIEIVERDTINWFAAVKSCGDFNARLCTQSEWVFACQKSSVLNLLNMTDNMEWIDSAGNSGDNCKTMGMDQFGTPGCNSGYSRTFNLNKSFRCCYSK